jgi:hypothetical protein
MMTQHAAGRPASGSRASRNAAANLRLTRARRAEEEEEKKEDEPAAEEEEEETPTTKKGKRGKNRGANEPTDEKDEDAPAGKKSKSSKRSGGKAEEEEEKKDEEYAEEEEEKKEDEADARATAAARNVLATERKRIAALRAEFADDPKFAMKAIDKGWSVRDAKAEYSDVLRKRTGGGKASAPTAGNRPLTRRGPAALEDDHSDDTGGEDFDASAHPFMQLVSEKAKANGGNRARAVSLATRERPDLHKAFLQEANPHMAIA